MPSDNSLPFATEWSATAQRCLRTELAGFLRWNAMWSSHRKTCNLPFYEWIERCGPFGVGHREPIFMSRSVLLASDVRIIKDRHICLEVTSGTARFSALGWSRAGILWTELCRTLELTAGTSIDIAYKLRAKSNSWFTGLELELIDLKRTAVP